MGRTGIIYAEEYEQLKDDGYGMNDVIGKDGLEAVLEPYLKGTDGYEISRPTADGRYDEEVAEAPEAGNYAELTLDLRVQEAAGRFLKKCISEAVGSEGAGAAIAVDPHTGEVLATCSSSYDPEEFNENYDELSGTQFKPLMTEL